MVRISGVPFGLEPLGAVGLDNPDMGAEPACLPGAAGEVPAAMGAITTGYDLNLTRDRAPGEDAVRSVRKSRCAVLGVEIGRGHGADRCIGQGTTR